MDSFWARVDKTGDCWIWRGAQHKNGYGAVKRAGKNHYAHRLAWELEHGGPPPGFVLHKCDVRQCVRPSHLFVGSQADNVADMHAKGRANKARGERNGRARLVKAQVREAKRRLRAGETHGSIAADFGVHRDTIRAIANGRSWAS